MSGSKEFGVIFLLPVAAAGAVFFGAGAVVYGAAKGGIALAKWIKRTMDESRLQRLEQGVERRVEDIRRQAMQDVQNRVATLNERLKGSERLSQELRSHLAQTESAMVERLKTQNRDFTERLAAQRGEYRSLIEAHARQTEAALKTERQARQKAVDNLQGQLNQIAAEGANKRDIAASIVSDLSKIVAETRRTPHERFAPGRLQAIERHVQDAKGNVQIMPEAALSTAQRAYWDMVDLREEVLFKERDFMLIYQAALAEARSILEEARANRKYALEFGEGHDRTSLDLEVDHWTRGELSAFEDEVRSIEQKLSAGEKTLATDTVKAYLSDLEDLKPRIPQVVERAKVNIFASQVRQNMGVLAAEALATQGFQMIDWTYEGGDERNAYVVKVRNVAGSEVVTVISPVADEIGKARVAVNSYDERFVDEGTLEQRAREICETLHDVGLQVAPPQRVGTADSQYRDLEAVRTRVMPLSQQERSRA